MKLNLIDEYQLCVHPVIAGSGLPLFENINDRTILKLIKTKTFSGGAVILYYEPRNEYKEKQRTAIKLFYEKKFNNISSSSHRAYRHCGTCHHDSVSIDRGKSRKLRSVQHLL